MLHEPTLRNALSRGQTAATRDGVICRESRKGMERFWIYRFGSAEVGRTTQRGEKRLENLDGDELRMSTVHLPPGTPSPKEGSWLIRWILSEHIRLDGTRSLRAFSSCFSYHPLILSNTPLEINMPLLSHP